MLKDFRFKLPEIAKITDKLQWSGVTERNGYRCAPIAATCVMLYRFATTTRRYECDIKFGMFTSQLSEVFLGENRALQRNFWMFLDLRGSFLRERAVLYAEAIEMPGAPLDSCVLRLWIAQR